jgi:dTMP kinase
VKSSSRTWGGSTTTSRPTEGLFIVLEGVEGAGKSTQAHLLSQWMDELGIPHTLAREPGGTPVGEAIRSIVLNKGEISMSPETELFLMLGARAGFVREIVRPALLEGQVVLADRFDFSTFAYQGYGRGLDLEQVRQANALATGGLKPNLTLVFDLPVEVGLERKGGASGGDRIEQEGESFLSRVREGYRAVATNDPSSRILSAECTPQELHEKVRGILGETFPGTFPSGMVD